MRRVACIALTVAAAGAVAAPPARSAEVLDIPGVVPRPFRAVVRQRLHIRHRRRPSFDSRLSLRTSQGYELAVVGKEGAVAVEVSRSRFGAVEPGHLTHFDQAITAYVARGIVTQNRIEASFGRFGEIDVRFRPSGRIVDSPRRGRCGARSERRLGVYVGRIRFAGEDRYVTAHAHRAKGRVRAPLRSPCAARHRPRPDGTRQRPVPAHEGLHLTSLTAGARSGLAATEFVGARFLGVAFFVALTEESLGSVARIRVAATIDSEGAFALSDALTVGHVRPLAPFHGRGVYRAAPDGSYSWTGPLSVSFPGAPRTPLTGEQFEVKVSADF